MKPSVIETGTVVDTDGPVALIRMDHGRSCKGCGMGEIGLCTPGGSGMLLRAENRPGARAGDRVTVGLGSRAMAEGLFVAYLLPLAGLLAGAAAGLWLDRLIGAEGLEVAAGFIFLALTLAVSLARLRKMDRERRLIVTRVLQDIPESCQNSGSSEADAYIHNIPCR